MSISFKCPWCGGLCGFHDKYAARRARCQRCWKLFIIPSQDGGKSEKVKEKVEVAGGPFSGFYRAVLRDSWKLFIRPRNATGLVFIVAVVCFAGYCVRMELLCKWVITKWLSTIDCVKVAVSVPMSAR